MLSGHLQAKFLGIICKMLRAKFVLEIGTFTGYSAISMAKAMGIDSVVHTIDINDELESFTSKFIKLAGQEHKIMLHIGDALDIIPKLTDKFDLIFIDADKREYVEYYEAVLPLLREGGVIIADDVLWDGKVIKDVDKNDKQTQGIMAFNKHVKNDDRVENIILPIRHGLNMIMKK
jgi:predicted O-methyltransferase YrrM